MKWKNSPYYRKLRNYRKKPSIAKDESLDHQKIELAVAYIEGKVGARAITQVLGIKSTALSGFISLNIMKGIRSGELVLSRKDGTPVER